MSLKFRDHPFIPIIPSITLTRTGSTYYGLIYESNRSLKIISIGLKCLKPNNFVKIDDYYKK